MVNISTVDSIDTLKQVDDFMRFVFFPVGHGSCTLVSLPPEEPDGARIYGVIDCNDATARPIRAYLSDPWFDGEVMRNGAFFNLRFVMLTHYDKDHFLGIDHLLGKNYDFKFDYFLCPFPPPGIVADRLENHPRKKKILSDIQKLTPNQDFLQIDKVCNWLYRPKEGSHLKDIFKAESIAPPNIAIKKMKEWESLKDVTPFNILSAAIRFQWGDCSIIIGGDVEDNEWEEILSDFESKGRLHLLSANVALCSHHGGKGNPKELWQQISRCSSFHKQRQETERRVSRTIIIVSCSSSKEESPSRNSLGTFFNANSLIRCTSPAKVCLNLHAGEQPSCISDNNDTREELIELLPGEKPVRDRVFDLPSFAKGPRNLHSFKKGSICVDIFPKRSPSVYFHNGIEIVEITERCSCVNKL